MTCRGEIMRMTTLADISAHSFGGNRQDGFRSMGVVLTKMQGKMNREGKENNGYLLELWMVCIPLPLFLLASCVYLFTSICTLFLTICLG